MVASVSTKATAAPIPIAESTFLLTPRKGQIPKNCDSTILLTNIAVMNIRMYAISVSAIYDLILLTSAMR